MIAPGYRERQDARLAECQQRQIAYCEAKQKERDEMARGRPVKQATQALALLEALAWVKSATSEARLGINALHVRMGANMVMAFDGQMSAGHPIVEELELCPHVDNLITALKKSGKTLVISATENGRLAIKGDKSRAFVACLPVGDLAPVTPDPRLAPASDAIKAAFKCCGSLASEAGTRVIEATVLLRAWDCTGTNGAAMLQFWHGIDLPPGMVVPKVFADAVASAAKPIEGFGCSFNEAGRVTSLTLFFEGGAWLKTLTYADDWPNIEPLWQAANYAAVPEGLFDGVAFVAEFNDDGWVTFADNQVQSHVSPAIGAQYDVPGLQSGKQFAGKLIAKVAPYCGQIDLTSYPDRAFFVGGEAANPVRGILMAIRQDSQEVREPPPQVQTQPDPETYVAAAEVEGGWQVHSPSQGEPGYAGPFVETGIEAASAPVTTPESAFPTFNIGQTAQTNVSPSEDAGGWGQWTGEVDDNVAMPE